MARRHVLLVLALLAIAVASICLYWPKQGRVLKVATTTSLYATGLLDKLADEYCRREPGVAIRFIAVGTGRALELAARGDVDAVFVHAPLLERRYLNEGVLVDGTIIAYNYFVVVGPPSDPAGVRGLEPVEAFKKIYEAGVEGGAMFVSRGDSSGTHVKELSLWRRAGLDPKGQPWYLEAGAGMAKTLLVANERGAYTLSDIGTYLKLKAEGRLESLEVLVEGGRELINIYSAYPVNPERFEVDYELARSFIDFVSSDGQEAIGSYGVELYGRPLFNPAMGRLSELRQLWLELASGG